MSTNTQILFTKRPDAAVTTECFELRESTPPELPAGGVITRNLFLSCDPYMRGRMGTAKSYTGGFPLNQPIPSRVVAQIWQSDNERFKVGEFVWGFLNWESYTAVAAPTQLRIIDPALGPLSNAISVLGMPGLTAEVGMLELGMPKPGDNVHPSNEYPLGPLVEAAIQVFRFTRV